MTFSHEDVRKILAILDEADCEEMHIEVGDLKIDFRKHASPEGVRHEPREERDATSATLPIAAAAPSPVIPKATTLAAPPDGVAVVASPMLGTCYRAPSPGAKPFVEVGSRVGPDDTVCLVEVMKLFSSLKAGVGGTVESILFENATLVEYGQPLIWIRRDAL